MYKYVISGGRRLSGVVSASGAKNASLPILAASILADDIIKLYNIPKIEDVKITIEILKNLGCEIKWKKDVLIIDPRKINSYVIKDELMRKLRSSVIIVGALISKMKKATFSFPGGCNIGARPIDLHINNFKKLGIHIIENNNKIECNCNEIISTTIELDFQSVGATENLVLATVLGKSEVVIRNAAMEPEIVDLINFLNKMGAKIYGAGTNIIKVVGVNKLHGISYRIIPDRIEVGTLMAAAAITKGEVLIENVIPKHLIQVINKLDEMGCNISLNETSISVDAKKILKSANIKTMPYPGFPTDLQPIFSTLLTVSKGVSVISENIFENRFKYMQELQRLGAKATINGKDMVITGVKYLNGTDVKATDLRGGAALVLAGLIARGKTSIENVEYILRGYENIDNKLNLIGANITKENCMEVLI